MAVALCAFIWLFKGILLPFVAGIAIAYFLDPVADWMEKHGIGRGTASILSLLLFLLLAVAFLLLLFPIVQTQIADLSRNLPSIVQSIQDGLNASLNHFKTVLSPEDYDRLQTALAGQVQRAIDMLSGLLKGVLSQGVAVFEFLSVLVVTPVVAFYLLRDWDRIMADLDELIPLDHRETVHQQLKNVDETLGGFARGQGMVCLLLGLGYGGALALAGLPFGFTVGLTAGLISFIPYVGSLFGLFTSVGLALLEFDDLWRVALVAGIFLTGQAIEGNYLTPKLVGGRVRLHPVWVIFALFAGGTLLGFLGMLIALPVAAVIGVLVRFLVAQYRDSDLYDEEPDQPTEDRR